MSEVIFKEWCSMFRGGQAWLSLLLLMGLFCISQVGSTNITSDLNWKGYNEHNFRGLKVGKGRS